jgi:murein DD-endopeptidase MepM/ murein hydrolase activator NlpD
VLNTQRHAPVGRARAIRLPSRTQRLPHVYRGRARRAVPDIYDREFNEPRRGGRFRWVLSTFLAAGVGAVAIGVVLFGSLDRMDTSGGVIPALQQFREARLPQPAIVRDSGLNWSIPKSDRLQVAVGSVGAKHIIHEQVQVRRDNRPFIQIRPYMRIVARLSEVPPDKIEEIPPFNPLKLYAAEAESSEADGASGEGRSDVSVRVVELLGGILPGEDGQELDTAEVLELVARAEEAAQNLAIRPSLQPDDPVAEQEAEPDLAAGDAPAAEDAPNTTVLFKSVSDPDDAEDDLEASEVRVIRVARGDSLARILQRLGAEPWQINAMLQAARPTFPDNALMPGQEVHVTLVPSLSDPQQMEPVRFSIFAEGHEHKVTVVRNTAGEFVASAQPFNDDKFARATLNDSDKAHSASLYSSIYYAALSEGVPPEKIMQILRVHAYETDFRRRVGHGDMVDFFFDVKEDDGPDSTPGELLYTSITSGGEQQRFWRFRTPDGIVDYYDEHGNNSKRFLMRRPVRGDFVRLTSGYGMRLHPVINVARMHTGIDWAAPVGTPILAAGNGVVEEAHRKGGYGNYVRIRHANSYQTAYGHMSRIAPGIKEGVKVKQGQIIGYVGATGLASGPHLHYEILVNSRFVNPLQIQVPRERQLTGRQLAEFQKERARVDELMRRAPVMTASR